MGYIYINQKIQMIQLQLFLDYPLYIVNIELFPDTMGLSEKDHSQGNVTAITCDTHVPEVDLSPGLVYRAEGNANLVVAIRDTGMVLRYIIKSIIIK